VLTHDVPGSWQTQNVTRLADILLYGPIMIAIGSNPGYRLKGWERGFLLFGGISTIIVNGINYLANRKIERAQ